MKNRFLSKKGNHPHRAGSRRQGRRQGRKQAAGQAAGQEAGGRAGSRSRSRSSVSLHLFSIGNYFHSALLPESNINPKIII